MAISVKPHFFNVKHPPRPFTRKVAPLLWIVLAASTGAHLARAAEPAVCNMSLAFRQQDIDAPGGTTRVWAGLPDHQVPSALMFVEKLHVNTDGTRRSYKVSDFWGESDALNNLCNAMSDACAGLNSDELRQRRILTQEARAAGWPSQATAKTHLSPSIIPFRDGKPCPEVDGFLVSATALHRASITNACEIENYVDALVTPAIVLPKNPKLGQSEFSKRNAKVGDLVVALLPGSSTPVFAVVGDTGPTDRLGEGSVALNGKLLGRQTPPANYLEVRGKKPYLGKGWSAPPTFVLVFPGTRDSASPFMTPERIDLASSQIFERWGGVARAQTCIKAYKNAG